MRNLIESTLVSLDGVMGSPERWTPFDEESTQLATEELDKYDAFVLGRVTYEQLLAMAAELQREYGATENARFVREAAEVYRERGLC